MAPRRPHVVSAGYLRNFAAGKLIRVVSKADKLHSAPISVKDTFVRSNFLRVIQQGVSTDDAEDEFARVENAALPTIRTVMPRATLTEHEEVSVRAVIAMLWARSFAGEVVRERIHLEVMAEFESKYFDDPKFLRRFYAENGRPPEAHEVAELVRAGAERLRSERAQAVSAMLRHHNDALRRFATLHSAVYSAPPHTEFVTSDNPVILAADVNLMHVGAHNRLALGDANFIFLALTRTTAVCLTQTLEEGGKLTPLDMHRLNGAAWRNAVARIACHPSLDWAHACNIER